MKGGKPIGAGGFGCVFRPALLCKGETERSPKTVTKLMNVVNFKEEEAELKSISPYIAKIPNNEKYFVLTQIKKCVPKEFTAEDLKKFNEVCRPLIKGIKVRGRRRAYITSAEDIARDTARGYFVGLNLPDGGMDVYDYLEKSKPNPTKEEIARFLRSFGELVQKGIRPMNEVGVCHFDMKAENMVYDKPSNETKIIDWGFAKYTANAAPAPHLKKPFMFNQPFTNILFYTQNPKANPIVKYFINEFLGKNASVPQLLKNETFPIEEKKRRLVKILGTELRRSIFFNKSSIADYFGNDYVIGNYSYILSEYFGKNPGALLNTMSMQIANVLIEFSYDEKANHFIDFDLNRFFHTVFKFNVDIYGALTSLNMVPLPVRDTKRVMNYLMFGEEYAAKPYVIEDVLAQIQSLSEILVPTVAPPRTTVVPPLQARLNLMGDIGKMGIRQTSLGGRTQKKNKKGKSTRKKGKSTRKKGKSTRKKIKRK
tara:strand:+ start:651 stop:2099 length:1449 start_codon:yes stop_codon:yes gene_type:complete